MGVFFLISANAGNALSLLLSLIFIICVLAKSKIASDPKAMILFERERRTFNVAGFVFLVLYWFWSSGLATERCLASYHTIHEVCTFWGCAWMIYAFLNIFFGTILILRDRKNEVDIIAIFRKPSFIISGIYFLLSFIFRGL